MTQIITPETLERDRLNAAAPDLLAALKEVAEWMREHTSPRDANTPHEALVRACAAISKAEGHEAKGWEVLGQRYK